METKNFANEFCSELWDMVRMLAAMACATIGCVFGLPGLILSYIGDAFIMGGEWIHDGIGKKGAFEKDDVEEDEIIYT